MILNVHFCRKKKAGVLAKRFLGLSRLCVSSKAETLLASNTHQAHSTNNKHFFGPIIALVVDLPMDHQTLDWCCRSFQPSTRLSNQFHLLQAFESRKPSTATRFVARQVALVTRAGNTTNYCNRMQYSKL